MAPRSHVRAATAESTRSVRDDGAVRAPTLRVAIVAGWLTLAGAACGDDDDDTAATTTTTTTTTTIAGPLGSASDASCAARDELRDAISALTDIDVVRNGTSAITDALGDVTAALGDVRATAGADLQPQIDAFQQSIDELATAIGGGTSQIPAVVSALRDVGRTGGTLMSSLGNMGGCP